MRLLRMSRAMSRSDKLRSALARIKTQSMSTLALQTDEWRRALADKIQVADTGESFSPYRMERDLGNGLGKLILSACHPLTDDRPGNGALPTIELRCEASSLADIPEVFPPFV